MRYAALILLSLPLVAQTRIASDFEIQQMEQQVARSRDFTAQYSGHLNLGDLRATRNENVQARTEYLEAYEIAQKERLDARKASEMTRYATATSLAAAAEARLGDAGHAFELAEEAMRYTSDSSKSWNLYANMMATLDRPSKAAGAARNAVAIEERSGESLDLAIYRYTLASSLIRLRQSPEAERLLLQVVTSLRSSKFASLQRNVQEHEAFETYTTTRGEESAYVSLLSRAQLRLARLYEDRSDAARAREQYQNVLAARSDEPTALAAMTRLARNEDERARSFIDAFNANPFSIPLIRDYQRYIGDRPTAPGYQPETTGDRVRAALQQMQRGELTAARETLTALTEKFPNNDTLQVLLREVERKRSAGPVTIGPSPDLRALLAAFQDNRLTPEQRTQLDQTTFTSNVVFNGASPFESGTIEGVPFRFSEPTVFQGSFAANARLTYRILGATRVGEADGLLLEPVRLENVR